MDAPQAACRQLTETGISVPVRHHLLRLVVRGLRDTETVTKAQLVDRIAASADVSKQDAEKIVSSVFAAISKALQDGERLDIRGFGSFRARDRKARQARNLRTGETIQVPAQKVAVFKPSKELAQLLNPSTGTAGSE